MESSRRIPPIVVVVTIALVVAAIVAVIALRAQRAITGAGATNSALCKQRLTWATSDTGATMFSVAALSQTNAWAVGVRGRNAAIVHWDGSGWKSGPLPSISADSSALNMVSAVNAKDIWAVGRAGLQPLILHWNGATWTPVDASPVVAYSSQFSALAAVAADDVWAVGSALTAPNGVIQIIAEHWDGHTWKVTSAPPGTTFDAITASATGHIWGIITTNDETGQIVYWDGRAWLAKPTVDSRVPGLSLRTIAVGGDSEVWVAGSYFPAGANWAVPIVERWDGKSWLVVPSSQPEARGAWLTNLAVASDGTVWAAGTSRNINTRLDHAMLEHLGGNPQHTALYLYPSLYSDLHHGDAFRVTGLAVIPGSNAVWVTGGMGSVPNTSLPPIDSNGTVASGGFILAYC